MYPSVPVRRMFFVDFSNQLNNLLFLVFSFGFTTVLPLIVTGSADAHHLTEKNYVVLTGKNIYYPVFFGFKGM